MKTKSINICQPGYNASCSLCCGSHNYRLTTHEIKSLFKERLELIRKDDIIEINKTLKPKIIDDAIQCPFVGYTDNEFTFVGCLIYNSESEKLSPEQKSFLSGTCRTFSCMAREVLEDMEIIFAAKLMGDWFFYSLLINEIKLLKKIYSRFKMAENVPEDAIISIKNNLIESLTAEN